jgi:hypothetical protein
MTSSLGPVPVNEVIRIAETKAPPNRSNPVLSFLVVVMKGIEHLFRSRFGEDTNYAQRIIASVETGWIRPQDLSWFHPTTLQAIQRVLPLPESRVEPVLPTVKKIAHDIREGAKTAIPPSLVDLFGDKAKSVPVFIRPPSERDQYKVAEKDRRVYLDLDVLEKKDGEDFPGKEKLEPVIKALDPPSNLPLLNDVQQVVARLGKIPDLSVKHVLSQLPLKALLYLYECSTAKNKDLLQPIVIQIKAKFQESHKQDKKLFLEYILENRSSKETIFGQSVSQIYKELFREFAESLDLGAILDLYNFAKSKNMPKELVNEIKNLFATKFGEASFTDQEGIYDFLTTKLQDKMLKQTSEELLEHLNKVLKKEEMFDFPLSISSIEDLIKILNLEFVDRDKILGQLAKTFSTWCPDPNSLKIAKDSGKQKMAQKMQDDFQALPPSLQLEILVREELPKDQTKRIQDMIIQNFSKRTEKELEVFATFLRKHIKDSSHYKELLSSFKAQEWI